MGSRSSGPAITFIMSAASFTVRVIGPTCERLHAALAGKIGTRPNEGFKPNVPVNADGLRIDPPPSVPMWSGAIPAASAAPAPPDEPPGVRAGFHGLRVRPKTRLSVTPTQPKVGVFVLPIMMAPAAFMRATVGASSVGTLSR